MGPNKTPYGAGLAPGSDELRTAGTKSLSSCCAVILAGGLGTRLRSVVCDRPKVLAEVAGRPFLAYLLDRLVAAELKQVVLCVGHLGEMIADAFGESYRAPSRPDTQLTLDYSFEDKLLGTAGALRRALPQMHGDTILVLNGDSCFDTSLAALWTAHRSERHQATLALAHVNDTCRFGSVEFDVNGRILAFHEKSGMRGGGWINAGTYLFHRELIVSLEAERVLSLEKEIFPRWVREGRLHGVQAKGAFLDIGTPGSYAHAESFFARVAAGVGA